jgi:LPXTG-motif cell wall-anchored protein
MELLLPILGILLLALAFWLLRRRRKVTSRAFRAVTSIISALAIILAVVALVVGGYLFWYNHRPLPANTQQALFEGVTYIREVRSEPRPLVISVVTVDLDAPGIAFLVTPGQPVKDQQLKARTTSQFLSEFGLQIAINGDFFEPFWSDSPFDYYPHPGDPVDVLGIAASNGTVYTTGRSDYPTLYISKDNKMRLNSPIGDVYNAISGNIIFLERGKLANQSKFEAYHLDPHPRTVVALSADGRTLIIAVVDGRQPNYSEGISLPELAEMMVKYGADTALNLDGGGSSALITQGESGQPIQLNSPIDNRFPGRERVVGNHLGIYARKLAGK